MDLPEARERLNTLFDIYEALLTQRQREIFTMHYMDDCSLAETGEVMGISPQAVADILKRTAGRLNRYDGLLGLAEKQGTQHETLEKIKTLLVQLEDNETILQIKSLIETLSV
jgi:hypothetical protein